MRTLIVSLLMTIISSALHAQTNRIDLIRPDAPVLAAHGPHAIGVRTLEVSDSERPDVLNMRNGEDTPLYERSLTLEVWYPAQLSGNQRPGTEYQSSTRNTSLTATLHGRAMRDADALQDPGAFPLIIMSHGYPGNRYLLSHLGENLASKGYVVVSIDHRDSTYEDQQNINSTLYNRAVDQRFVLDAIAGMAGDNEHFLNGVVDPNNTALIGYSMGGYGVVNNLGAGYSDGGVRFIAAPPNGLLNELAASNPEFSGLVDSRIRAGIPIAPWGMNTGFWDADGLAGIRVPTLFVAGDADTTSGYENGIKAIYDGAVNSDRHLLVFKNAGHSAAAPIPMPVEFFDHDDTTGAGHYTDPVWDSVRMNNILQHFVTAFLDLHLKGDTEQGSYLDVIEDGADGVYAINPDGQARQEHTYWKGFGEGSAVGLKMYRN